MLDFPDVIILYSSYATKAVAWAQAVGFENIKPRPQAVWALINGLRRLGLPRLGLARLAAWGRAIHITSFMWRDAEKTRWDEGGVMASCEQGMVIST